MLLFKSVLSVVDFQAVAVLKNLRDVRFNELDITSISVGNKITIFNNFSKFD